MAQPSGSRRRPAPKNCSLTFRASGTCPWAACWQHREVAGGGLPTWKLETSVLGGFPWVPGWGRLPFHVPRSPL